MKQASLFIGRWAPFHEGHQALIESVLETGKPVVIAIRDTEVSTNNPYSISERWTMIQDALQRWGSLVRIIVIPDIDEVCYGRDVGYDIRKIDLTKDIHEISATRKRQSTQPNHPIVWLTGQSGSGKTTLAQAIRSSLGEAVILDGDEMRESISTEGFSPEDRNAHNFRVARLAQVLSRQSPVIVSVIAPFAQTRREIHARISPLWVLCTRHDQKKGEEFPYELPGEGEVDVIADGNQCSPTQNASKVIMAIKERCEKLSSGCDSNIPP
jgi:energy-coupling factor transporter ATP-binding protein EcfA2